MKPPSCPYFVTTKGGQGGKSNSYCSVHRLQLGQYNGRRRNGPKATKYQTYRKYTNGFGKDRRYTKQYKKVNINVRKTVMKGDYDSRTISRKKTYHSISLIRQRGNSLHASVWLLFKGGVYRIAHRHQ